MKYLEGIWWSEIEVLIEFHLSYQSLVCQFKDVCRLWKISTFPLCIMTLIVDVDALITESVSTLISKFKFHLKLVVVCWRVDCAQCANWYGPWVSYHNLGNETCFSNYIHTCCHSLFLFLFFQIALQMAYRFGKYRAYLVISWKT